MNPVEEKPFGVEAQVSGLRPNQINIGSRGNTVKGQNLLEI